VSARAKLVLALGLLVLVLLALWQALGTDGFDEGPAPVVPVAGDPPIEPPPPVPGRAPERADPGETPPDEPPTETPTEPPTDEPAKKEEPLPPGGGDLTGYVVLEGDGRPNEVRLKLTRHAERGEEDRSPFAMEVGLDSDGGFRVQGLPAGRYRLDATHPRLATPAQRFAITAVAGAGPLEIAFRAGGAIRVTVLDAAGQPMGDQSVQVSGPSPRTGRTGSDGQVLLAPLAVGSYRIRWQRGVRKVAVVEGKTVEYTFRETAVLTATVEDGNGIAPERFIVKLRPVKYGPEGYRDFSCSGAGKETVTIRNIQPGEYRIDVQVLKPDSYVAGCGTITLGPGETAHRDLEIRATLITGRITREDTGRPMPSRQVQGSAQMVKVENGEVVDHLFGTHAMAFTDEDGVYSFVGIEPGHWQIWICPHTPALREVYKVVEVIEGGQTVGLDFELQAKRLGTLRLRIVGPDGKAAPKGLDFSRVNHRDGKKWWTTLRPTRRVDGAYEFDFDEGERRVAVYLKGWRPEPEEVVAKIVMGKTVEKTCTMIRQGAVIVTVRDAAGEAVEKPIIWAMRRGEKEKIANRWPLRDGGSEIWLDPGEVTIHARLGDARTNEVTVRVKIGESVSAELQLAE
jgi:hypothetical protein